jgi:hypothetical protein
MCYWHLVGVGASLGATAQASRSHQGGIEVKDLTIGDVMGIARNTGFDPHAENLFIFAAQIEFVAGEARLNHCIELLEKNGYDDAAELLKGQG